MRPPSVCPGCGKDPSEALRCRWCGEKGYLGWNGRAVRMHKASCVSWEIEAILRDVRALPHADSREVVLLCRRMQATLRMLVRTWPREEHGKMPTLLLKLGDMVEAVIKEDDTEQAQAVWRGGL